MVCVELIQRIVNLLALPIGPRLRGKLGCRLHCNPTPKRACRENQPSSAASRAHDPSPRSIEGGSAPRRRHLAAMDTAIERRREAKQRKSSDLEAEQGLLGGRAFVER